MTSAEDVVDEPSFLRLHSRTHRFTLGTPREFRIAPDGSRVLFLRSASGTESLTSLWSLDLATGQETRLVDPATLIDGSERLTDEERAARERSRTDSSGVVGYATDDSLTVAVFALSGKLFLADVGSGAVRELPAVGPVMDPRPDPTGQRVAYVAGGALRVIGVDGTGDRALAEPEDGDTENIAWGLAEFVAAEEMERSRGYWWSPDGTRLLAARTDRSAVSRWYVADPANPERPATRFAYPAAGTANVSVGLFVLGVDGTRITVNCADSTELPYLTSVHWSAGGPPLIAVQSRDQRRIVVRTVDPASGATATRQELTDPHWVDIVPATPAWTPDGRLVTVAARDGAYRLLVDGEPVTGTDLQVRAVLDAGADVLFTATAADPTQVRVYATTGAEVTEVSDVDGVHTAARAGDITVLTSWSLAHFGPKVTVLRDGKPIGEIASLAVTPPLEPNPALLTVGERDLRCALLLPTGHVPGTKLPVLLDPYGGPHAQRVLHGRNSYLIPQWLADQGFAVLVADGRGTPGRGPDWDRSIARNLADVTVADQVDALHAVAAQYPDLDLERVAIRGWSYGGYLSAAAVLRRPDAVHAALVGAPVIDWRLYDTHYTERYLGHPDENPDVYERNSLIADAPSLTRPLLLIHGLADDNVYVAHTLRLSAALLAAGRDHTVLPLSGATHMGPTGEREAESFMLLQVNWLRRALAR